MTNIEQIITCGKKKLPKILNKEQLLMVMRQIKEPSVAMAMFLSIFMGLRIGEMSYIKRKDNTLLKWEDVDLKFGEITILDAKNPRRFKSGYGKDRIVPIFDEFLHIFRMWKEICPKSKYVVPHHADFSEPMNTRYLQDRMAEALEKSDLVQVDYYQKNGTPRYKFHFHTFRHVCATNLLRRGLKIEQVKEFLGHEKLDTTMVYLDIVKDDLKEAVTKAYAYPQRRNYFLPQAEQPKLIPEIELMRLENENLKLKMQMAQQITQQVMIR